MTPEEIFQKYLYSYRFDEFITAFDSYNTMCVQAHEYCRLNSTQVEFLNYMEPQQTSDWYMGFKAVNEDKFWVVNERYGPLVEDEFYWFFWDWFKSELDPADIVNKGLLFYV